MSAARELASKIEAQANTSRVEVFGPSFTVNEDNSVVIEYSVGNRPTDGFGAFLTDIAVDVQLDGNTVRSHEIDSISEGNVVDFTATAGPVEAGQHEACITASTSDAENFSDSNCNTFAIEAAESTAAITQATFNSPAAETAEATFTVANEVSIGAGEQLTIEVDVSVDGSVQQTKTYTLGPGESTQDTVAIPGVSGGNHEVCVSDPRITQRSPA